MHLVVGLGNPGSQYLMTRHNIGFMAMDALAERVGTLQYKNEKNADTFRTRIDGEDILIAKPQKFMNLSGQPVQQLLHYYKIPTSQLLVIHDDIDQPFGNIRFQSGRGHGGHNGIRDIHQKLATSNYTRLKVGVGRPPNPRQAVADYVLSDFNAEENDHLPELLATIIEALRLWTTQGTQKAANQFNGSIFKKETQ